MLKEMRDAAEEARQLGCSATADAMEALAAQYVELATSTPSAEGELKPKSIYQESHLATEKGGAARPSCCNIVKCMSKFTYAALDASTVGLSEVCYSRQRRDGHEIRDL